MSKEPEMSDELTKLDNIKAVLTTADRMLWDMNYTTAEPAVIAVEQAIAALDALLLTPPVDPVVALFREAFAGSEVNNLGGYWSVERRFRELVSERSLELRTVADGGGA